MLKTLYDWMVIYFYVFFENLCECNFIMHRHKLSLATEEMEKTIKVNIKTEIFEDMMKYHGFTKEQVTSDCVDLVKSDPENSDVDVIIVNGNSFETKKLDD